ncbi:hypothetical protein [Brevibacillus sp. NRS-1366]|uniref:hypothetical protein n=1 Tax=Brevibacillus sp. NRS-1366 TaxID=3233899 RepID=UPI003D1C81CE
MENKLTTWIHSSFADDIINKIKETIKKEYLLKDYEITPIDNGFAFMFDDESTGEIQISIKEQKDTHSIQITGEFDWEVVDVYTRIQTLLTDIVEGAV